MSVFKKQKQENEIIPYLLYKAIKRRSLLGVNFQIKTGANVNAFNKNRGESPALIVAINSKNFLIVKALLDAGANPFANGRWVPLNLAVRTNQLEIVKELILKGVDPNEETIYGPILSDVRSVEVADFLVKKGAVLDQSCLQSPVFSGNCELVKFFLSLGMNPHCGENSPFFNAVVGNLKTISLFDATRCTSEEADALWGRVEKGKQYSHVFKFLVQNNINPTGLVKVEDWKEDFFLIYKPNMLFLALARESPQSPFYKDDFPLDLAKEILKFMNFVCKENAWKRLINGPK